MFIHFSISTSSSSSLLFFEYSLTKQDLYLFGLLEGEKFIAMNMNSTQDSRMSFQYMKLAFQKSSSRKLLLEYKYTKAESDDDFLFLLF